MNIYNYNYNHKHENIIDINMLINPLGLENASQHIKTLSVSMPCEEKQALFN